MARLGMKTKDVVSYFLRNGFLNRENDDIVNAIYIANKVLKIMEYPFDNSDFEQEDGTLKSKKVERILGGYASVTSLLNRSYKNPREKDQQSLAKTAEYLSGFSSEKLGDVARYMFSPEENKDLEEYSEKTICAIKLSLGIKL